MHRYLFLYTSHWLLPMHDLQVKKIKGIYHTLNMFNLDMTKGRCLIAECWCSVEDLDEIQRALTRGTVSYIHVSLPHVTCLSHVQERSGSTVPSILNRMKSDEKPPTYNKVNKFTRGFQAIVDAYGVATYEEVNPSESRQPTECTHTHTHAHTCTHHSIYVAVTGRKQHY